MMRAIIQHIRQTLRDYYPESEINALVKILFTDILGIDMLDYYAGKDIKISAIQIKEIDNILERLKKYEPIQYIVGFTEFYGMRLKVNPAVLIPRPETEELVDLIVRDYSVYSDLTILDIGTGSGCIALSLAKHLSAKVTGWDISKEALAMASENGKHLNLDVSFSLENILYHPPTKLQYDIIVSNPPYITDAEKAEMEANVLNWEPDGALFVPDNEPLLFYEAIAGFGLSSLTKEGQIYFEINRQFGTETKLMMEQTGYREVSVVKDMAGNDRIIKAKR